VCSSSRPAPAFRPRRISSPSSTSSSRSPVQLYSERELARRIAAIGDPALRDRCAGALSEPVGARDRVGRGAGHHEALEASLHALDVTLEQLTGRPPTRRPGQTYAVRGLVYEDCRRDWSWCWGQFLSRLGPPLSLVLDGVHWAAGQNAAGMREHVRERHAQLRDTLGITAIDADHFRAEVRRAGHGARAGRDTAARGGGVGVRARSGLPRRPRHAFDRRDRSAGPRGVFRARQLVRPRRLSQRSACSTNRPASESPAILDFNSPMFPAVFIRPMKQLTPDTLVRLEEMFPDVTDAWLEDAAGARYTCEMRFAASFVCRDLAS
jgi:hypothetical protein